MRTTWNLPIIILLLLMALLAGGCTSRSAPQRDLPPILLEEELIRPYVKLGRIQVTREVYGSDLELKPDIREWGYRAIQEEAARIGADAVIHSEVTGRTITYIIMPSTEYRASGIAVKFK
ncbi:MAG: hypothetical protein HYV06_02605 [Deltaproteobacteria bacterium]|nr:hypothetical protein [Deltaproteobacteria bacterium]